MYLEPGMINIEDMEVTSSQFVPGPVTVRIVHKPTGITASACHEVSYLRARREALELLRKKLEDARQTL
jgi:hypothetical protein